LKRKETGILAIMGILSIVAGIIVVILTVVEFMNHAQSLGSTGIGIALGVILIVMGFISRKEVTNGI
jgi:uncharacterized membrane protein (DUF485 family)